MGGLSIWHWLIVLVIALLLFGGGGKVSKILGDLGAGLKNFKKNIQDEDVERTRSKKTKKTRT